MAELPSGTVTFFFTDVEGSTRLLLEHGDCYADMLAAHRRTIRTAIAAHGGVEFGSEGDALFAAFARAGDAAAAAADAQAALAGGPVQVRMGLHTGTAVVTHDGYVGIDVHRAARIAAAAHGGQVVLSSATAQLVDAELRDLGEHRLKDLSEPVRIFQLGRGNFPPLTTLSHTNLPTVGTAFLGRRRELAEVCDLIGRDEGRLVTLTGPGGTGKTRLAIQAAAELTEGFADGAWWVPLAAVRDTRLVLESLAQALGTERDLVEHIGAKRMLVVFDSFEHVLAAAPGVAALRARCPGLRLLVTSREPIHVLGEWEYRVDPLSEAEAVELFMQRARAVERDVELTDAIGAICRRVDCLPLAVELAAARIKVLSPPELLERLERRLAVLEATRRDAPERQRTLRTTIGWSHDLLSPTEQRLFARLAVFAGGCSLAAAEDVGAAEFPTLGSLIDKSLVRRSGERYWMLETIRDFAQERLDSSGEDAAIRERHAAWFAALADRAKPKLVTGKGAWFDELEVEHANIRDALAWTLPRCPDVGRRIAAAIWRFWAARGYRTEGRRWVEAALDAGGGEPEIEAELLYAGALFAMWAGDRRAGRARIDRLQDLAERSDLPLAAAAAVSVLALDADLRGDHVAAVRFNDEAAAVARANGDRRLLGVAINNAGDALLGAGDLAAAAERFEEGLLLAREDGDRQLTALALANLGYTALGVRDGRRARSFLREALEEAHAIEFRDGMVAALLGLGVLSVGEDPARAVVLLAAADKLVEDDGGRHTGYDARLREDAIDAAREALGRDGFAGAYGRGRILALDDVVREALAV
jgi:predicted ATPase